MEVLEKDGKFQLLMSYEDICEFKELLDTHLLLPQLPVVKGINTTKTERNGWDFLEKILRTMDLIFDKKDKKNE